VGQAQPNHWLCLACRGLAWLGLAWLVWLCFLFFSMGLTSIKETPFAKNITGFVQRDLKGFETRLK
jgi:hypothetical protein